MRIGLWLLLGFAVSTSAAAPLDAILPPLLRVSSGQRGDDHLLVVVLGSTSGDARYVDTRNLFRWSWRERARK